MTATPCCLINACKLEGHSLHCSVGQAEDREAAERKAWADAYWSANPERAAQARGEWA